MNEKSPGKHPVLLAEDNIDDVFIARRFWEKANIENPLYVVRDGEEALDFLFKRGDYADAPEASLILLDLSMPKVDGFEVLKEIRSGPLKRLPAIILTGSNREEEMNRANDLGCDGFLVKPLTFDNFVKAVIDIQRFSLCVAELPDE